jgi:GAF domain-containing protein/HAMP domain-containing protein
MINRFFSPRKNKEGKEQKRFGFWGNLRLSRKLLLAFIALFFFAGIIAIVTLNGLDRTQSAYENTLAQGLEIRRLSDQLAADLQQARDEEKSFLLNWRKEGYDTAYKNYVTIHVQDVDKMNEDIQQLALFGPVAATVSTGATTQAQYEADITSLTQNVYAYEQSFNALVNAYKNKGFDSSTDFEYQMRDAVLGIDTYLSYGPIGVESINITFLRIRISEKNYLADAAQPYANDIHSLIPVFKNQIEVSTRYQPNEKTDMLSQVDAYVTAFDALVALDKQIAVSNKSVIDSALAVESLTKKIQSLGNQLAIDGINTARANSTQTFTLSVITALIVLVFSILIAVTFSQQLTRPIISLTRVAQEISAGKFDMQAQVESADEIGTLAQTFNNMTVQLQGALQNLDHRARELEEQTVQLELTSQQSEKRSRQLQTISEIARYISSEKDLNKLLPLITQTVSEQFGFYHVGVFLLDDIGKYAILLASNSPGGQAMLRRQHKLEVGQTGIVGDVTASGNPRIALDTGAEAVFFNNPDLPQTRSEMALPLKVEDMVIGALDIQSTETNAFSDEDVEALKTLADQVSIAIQNTRLFNQIERALAESNAIQRQYIRETWSRLPKEEKLSGYRYSIAGAIPLGKEADPMESEAKKGRQEINVPIILRGETIGTLSVQVPETEPVDADQMELIKAVAERVALSAENARLFEDTTRRAERERIISDIASKIGTSVRTENILRTTAKELSQLLDDADIFINLRAASNGKEVAK